MPATVCKTLVGNPDFDRGGSGVVAAGSGGFIAYCTQLCYK
jgi:hypothetical protein